MRNYDWRDYESLFEAAAAVCPRSAKVQYNLAHMHADRGDLLLAARHYQEALAIHPAYYQALANLASFRSRSGDRERALSLYTRALEAQPAFSEAYYNLGFALHASGDVRAALPLMQNAVRLQPDVATMAQGLGNALQANGLVTEALALYRRSVLLEPNLASGYNNIGACLLSLTPVSLSARDPHAPAALEKLVEARTAFDMALTLNPLFPEALYGVSSAFTRLRQARGVVGVHDGGEQLEDSSEMLRKAARHLLMAVRVSPGYAKAYHSLGNLISSTGNHRGAAEMALGFAVRLSPASPDMYNSLAANLHLSARYGDALGWYSAALALQPDFAGVYFNAGNALLELHRFAEAESMLAKAAELQPASRRYQEAYAAAVAAGMGEGAGRREGSQEEAVIAMPLVMVPGFELEDAVVDLFALGEGDEGDEKEHGPVSEWQKGAGGFDTEGEWPSHQGRPVGASEREDEEGMRAANMEERGSRESVWARAGASTYALQEHDDVQTDRGGDAEANILPRGMMIIEEEEEDEEGEGDRAEVGGERSGTVASGAIETCGGGLDDIMVEGEDYYEMYQPPEQ